uniref:Imidazole glycerol phosphate synthase subunit HisF n=1 Tax=Lygus hesperus TaxID=30085 RepID=A0A0A9VU30_LYGHE
MNRIFLLACLLVQCFQQSDSDADLLEELVVKGWVEHRIIPNSTQLKNVIYPGITLTDAALSNRGTMRVTSAPKHTKSRISVENVLQATIDDLTIEYNYTLDSGESGQTKIEVMNRTYTIKFQSILVGGLCRTTLIDFKLLMEGPVKILADGGNSNKAVKIVERMHHVIVLQSRSFAYYEIIAGLNESLKKREPKLCKDIQQQDEVV